MNMMIFSGCSVEQNTSPVEDDHTTMQLDQIEEALAAYPSDSLNEAEITGLLLMREEEKLARDVYSHLFETWGMRIFNNISNSESTHMLTIKVILDRYDIEDPITYDAVGKFKNTDLSSLYSSLTTKGDSSLVQALTVGATIEDLDIFDLLELSEASDNEDILFAYDNLTRGSRNHIRSFVSKLTQNGVDYKAQFISNALLDSILSTPKELGRWQTINNYRIYLRAPVRQMGALDLLDLSGGGGWKRNS